MVNVLDSWSRGPGCLRPDRYLCCVLVQDTLPVNIASLSPPRCIKMGTVSKLARGNLAKMIHCNGRVASHSEGVKSTWQ